ncbi:TPA: hypothetical protein RHU88_003723 [Escherichia coli]|nr:hypothetical protein [Escherichia coli]
MKIKVSVLLRRNLMFLFKIPPEKKGTTGAESELFGLCRFLSLFLSVE